jgi:predicted alpha/beta superfamily hydrolase
MALFGPLFLPLPGLGAGSAQVVDPSTLGAQEAVLFSEILQEERVLRIRLPAGYEWSELSYPVLFVLDAEIDVPFHQSLEALGELEEEGAIPEMILVGINNVDRNRDMFPTVLPHRPGSGGGEAFLRFVLEELIPHIETEYRTDGARVLYGASNAGFFTVFALLREPEVFLAGIASSPMIGHANEFMLSLVGETPVPSIEDETFLYMIYGENDAARCTEFVGPYQEILKSLEARAFRSELVMVPGQGHVPEGSLRNGLLFVFGERGRGPSGEL